MKQIKILDCTLRDGGYVVDTMFGEHAIRGITKKLTNSNIDIIELGYVKDCTRKEGSTTYSRLEEIQTISSSNSKYAVMIEYNTFNTEHLIDAKNTNISIVRICFFKKDIYNISKYAQEFINRGYDVFLQPMDTLGYNDYELLELINITNKLNPKALYIVDSYGSMYNEDLDRIYSLINHNLNSNIHIGLHSHNNLQLSFTLAQKLIEISLNQRDIIIDSSCCGIGRGAGNTNTELLVNYLNKKMNKNYDINEILEILDNYILKIQQEHKWGYSVPYFISGMYNIHVNNIKYLLNKHNLKAKDMRIIVSEINKNSEQRYNYEELENLIINYFSNEIDDSTAIYNLKQEINNKPILILAPGASVISEKEKINKFIQTENPTIISINSINNKFNADFLFFSNYLRYEYAKDNYSEIFNKTKRIITSNLKTDNTINEYVINYNTLIERNCKYFDNSSILCLRLLIKLGAKNIAICGLDGYSKNENYFDKNIVINLSEADKNLLNTELAFMYNDILNKNPEVNIKIITHTNIKV